MHQGRMPGLGLDCVGLLILVAHELGLTDYDIDGYTATPNPRILLRELDSQMDRIPIADAQIGDVFVMSWHARGESELPQHLGIKTRSDPDYLIHVYNDGPRRVVEHIIDHVWRSRIVLAYRFRGIE